MIEVTATQLARRLREILDLVQFRGEQVSVYRNGAPAARIVSGVAQMTALEAMADLYKTLPESAGVDWLEDSKSNLSNEIKEPWDF